MKIMQGDDCAGSSKESKKRIVIRHDVGTGSWKMMGVMRVAQELLEAKCSSGDFYAKLTSGLEQYQRGTRGSSITARKGRKHEGEKARRCITAQVHNAWQEGCAEVEVRGMLETVCEQQERTSIHVYPE